MPEETFKPERVFEAGSEGPAKQLKGKELEEWEEKQLRNELWKEQSVLAKKNWVQVLLKISNMPEEEWIAKRVEENFEKITRMREERKKEREKQREN